MANSIAYGFISHEDIFREKVNENIELVTTAIEESIRIHQEELDDMLSILVQKTTEYQVSYALTSKSTLQPLDEWGNPLPVKPFGKYGVAFPIQQAGIAWGDNRVSRAKMTVGDANRLTWTVQTADIDWQVRHILAAIFTNVTWTYPDEEHDDLTVQPLANGDSVEYVMKNGNTATDNHYLGQANPIDNSNNPFPTLYTELSEHPSNSGPYVAYIPTNLVDDVKALSGFVEIADPDIQVGANSDTVRGTIDAGFGDEVLGKVDKMWIVEWQRLPDNYILALALGADPVVAMREHEEAELQGLQPEFQNVDGNRHLNKYIRMAGYGVINRVGAVVMEIGDASYDIPTGFQAPLPV